MKPGYKSTEFWVSVVTQLIGVLSLFGIVSPTGDSFGTNVDQLIGGIITLISGLSYLFIRFSLKKKELINSLLPCGGNCIKNSTNESKVNE